MKKFISLIRLMTLSIFCFNLSAHASFEDLGAGARAPGMADVFVGVADGADAVYYNPSGLTQLRTDEISMQYGQLMKGSTDGTTLGTTYLSAAHPLRHGRYGTLGFAYNNFKAQSLFSERTLIFSYGWKLKVIPFGWDGIWSMGVNAKQFHRQYEPDRFTENALNDAGNGSNKKDPLFASNGYSKDAYALDWGGLYQFGPSQKASAGITLQNINRPDVSLANDGDKAPFIAKFGLAYRPKWGLISGEARRTTRMEKQTDTDTAIAVERVIKTLNENEFSLRGGYASGSRNYKAVTAGLSYKFSRARLDYAFSFPMSSLPGSDGGHRLGLSIVLGGKDPVETQPQDEINDLLSRFGHDASASHACATRGFISLDTPKEQQALILQLLVSKYPMDRNSAKIHKDLSQLDVPEANKVFEWPELKDRLSQYLMSDDVNNFNNTLDIFVKGDSAFTLARMALLSNSSKNMPIIKLFELAIHGELAAQAYRNKNIDPCIDHVRQMMDLVPQDPVVVDAYRKLLLMRTQNTVPQETPKDREVPEAPIALVAPTPTETSAKNSLLEKDALVKSYGEQLGYYLARKSAGASAEEKRALLNQIQTLYANKGIDLSLMLRELTALGEVKPVVIAPPTPVPSVVATPELVVVEKPVEKSTQPLISVAERKQVVEKYKIAIKAPIPIIERSFELDWALMYYKKAVERGISDPERVEILESIVIRFGEVGAQQVSKDLDRIRRRIQR